MRRSRIVMGAGLSFMIGLIVSHYLPTACQYWDLMYFSLLLCSVLICIFSKNKWRITALWGCFFFFGLWRYSWAIVNANNELWPYYDQSIELVGYLASEPKIRLDSQQLLLSVQTVDGQSMTGKVLMTSGLGIDYYYGQNIKATCILRQPRAEYGHYLALQDITSLCYYPTLQIITGSQAKWWTKKIIAMRQATAQRLSVLRPPVKYLALASLLNYQETLTPTVKEIFNRSGLSHLMAISGLNITILAVLILNFLLLLNISRPYAFYVTSILLWFYIILIGAPPSAMRAAMMGWLVLWAMYLGRLSQSFSALLIAAGLMLVWQPLALFYDLGWQLSFMAVLGLLTLYPWLVNKLSFIPYKIVREIMAITLAAQLSTWPLLANSFGTVSLVAPLANLLTVWLIPVIMSGLIIGLLLSWLIPALSIYWFLPSELGLHYIWWVAKITANLPLASVNIQMNLWWILSYYGLLILWYWRVVWHKNNYN